MLPLPETGWLAETVVCAAKIRKRYYAGWRIAKGAALLKSIGDTFAQC
jgi:hypothetical protein